MEAERRYIFTVRPTFEGPQVDSWYEVVEGEEQKVSQIFAMMGIRARVNSCIGPLMVRTPGEFTAEGMEALMRTYTPEKLKTFFAEATI